MAAVVSAAVGLAIVPWLNAEVHLRRLETLDPIRDAPDGRFLDVEGMTIHYEEAGQGDPIVLIHGFGGSTYTWRHNIDSLAQAGHVYAIDLPGFGYSHRTSKPVFTLTEQARFIAKFLEAVERNPTRFPSERSQRRLVLVGNSMGAAVALRFALDYPELTRALVLSAPSVFVTLPWSRLVGVFAVPLIGRALARTIYYYALANKRAAARMMASAYGSRIDEVTDEMRESWLRPMRVRGSADSALGLARSREERSFSECLDRIRAPVLILAGGRDRAVPMWSVERLQNRLANSELVVLDEAGHLLQEDEPDQFSRLVLEFLSDLS